MPVNGPINDRSVFPAATDNRSQVTVTFLGFRPRTIVSLRSAFVTSQHNHQTPRPCGASRGSETFFSLTLVFLDC